MRRPRGWPTFPTVSSGRRSTAGSGRSSRTRDRRRGRRCSPRRRWRGSRRCARCWVTLPRRTFPGALPPTRGQCWSSPLRASPSPGRCGRASRCAAFRGAATGLRSTRPKRSTRRCGSSSARSTPRQEPAADPGESGGRADEGNADHDRRNRGRNARGQRSGPRALARERGARPEGGSGTMTAMRAVSALLLSLALAAGADRSAGVTLEVANRKIFTFRATVVGSSPAERLESARARLEQVPSSGPAEKIETHPLQLAKERGTAVMVGPRLVFIVADGDVDLQGGETTEGVAGQAARMLAEALGAEREQRSVRLLLRSLLLAAMATAIMAGVI